MNTHLQKILSSYYSTICLRKTTQYDAQERIDEEMELEKNP